MQDSGVKINKEHALYALEDILGGHIAVACISMRNLVDLAENRNQREVRDLQAIIQKQLDQLIKSNSEYYHSFISKKN